MRVAKENIYEPVDEAAGLSVLAIPAGDEVLDEDLKRLGLKRSDARLEEVKPEED